MNQKVSIIIPVYNAERYLKVCFESLLQQTYKNIEIIAVNDGSKDKSLDILNRYAQNYPDIVKVLTQENSGVASARNLGLSVAEGEYITFVDSDDYVAKDYIENLLLPAYNHKMDVVISGCHRVNSQGDILFSQKLQGGPWSKYKVIVPWGRIFRKQFLDEESIVFPDFSLGEDVLFNLDIYSRTKKILSIPYIGYYWLDNEQSASNTLNKGFSKELDICSFLDEIKKRIPKQFYEIDLLKFFIRKFTVYWLLDGGRESAPTDFLEQYRKINHWIRENDLYSNLSPLSKKVADERWNIKGILIIFRCFEIFHLMKLFSVMYCKNKK
ncbi:glycosyltransferase [Streptococcus pneumoniae]